MSDTRNHTTRDQLAETIRHSLRDHLAMRVDESEIAADALLASDAIAAVRAAAVAETTATIEALPRLRRWIDDSELVDLNDIRAALSGGRTAPDTMPPVDPDDLCLTCGATNGVCGCPESAEEQPR